MNKKECKDCNKRLTKDEIALYKKIVDPKAGSFLCLECLSMMLDCTIEDLEIKIEEFKEQGCTLFI